MNSMPAILRSPMTWLIDLWPVSPPGPACNPDGMICTTPDPAHPDSAHPDSDQKEAREWT
jgi:hypothetical protein